MEVNREELIEILECISTHQNEIYDSDIGQYVPNEIDEHVLYTARKMLIDLQYGEPVTAPIAAGLQKAKS